jgi:protein-tyrosine-phosphatase
MARAPDETPPANSATMRAFVHWIRAAAPYVHAFRGQTFVIAFGGEVVADESFLGVVHDLNLLHSLGIKLVVVHGCRPQVEAILKQQGYESRYAHGVRITDPDAMDCVLEAAGQVRARIEALAVARPRELADGRRAQPRVERQLPDREADGLSSTASTCN